MTTALRHFTVEAEVPEGTLLDLFFEAIEHHGDRTALESFPEEGRLEGISYREVLAIVRKVAGALEAAGLGRGGRAAIFSENRPEWSLADWGCLCAGVIDVPIYSTLTAPQVAYILRDSEATLLFTSTPELVVTAREAVAECGRDVRIVAFVDDGNLPEGVTSWADFLASGEERAAALSDEEFEARARTPKPHDVATTLYTSGTTGNPKGVLLTHNNITSNVRSVRMVLDIGNTDNTISFLPLSHILQRMVDYLFFTVGCRIGYPRSLQTVIADMGVIRPTVVVSVPRIYEKVYNGVMEAEGLKKRIIEWAVDVADRVAAIRLAGGEPTGLLALKYSIADKLVFSKVKAAVGGRLKYFVSGGGPLEPTLNRFFYSIGMLVLEGYGLTETSPVTNVNTLDHFRIGTVGRPVPGTAIRIADDGEILVRGPQVMKGYFNRPEATAEVLDAEGWFATGDIGEIDADGFLKITDRKKDIIVTAGGKNVAPQPIENRLKTNRFVEQAIMIGDRRKYCSLLVVPAFPTLEAWAAEQGIEWTDRKELVADPRVLKHMESELFGMLTDLASFEVPKKIALLDEELTIENGFLTPKLSVKRKVVQERLGDVIDGLYEAEAVDAAQ